MEQKINIENEKCGEYQVMIILTFVLGVSEKFARPTKSVK
jgi:hypothetical protein